MANQSFILADAGGTGTQWRLVKNGVITQYETVGFNAYTHNIEDLKKSIEDTFADKIDVETPTFFYAAGVDTAEQVEETKRALETIFGSNVHAYNDLVGVARSLCGKDAGNVCILGTGANACYYNGEVVNKVGASLGYVLGDEGSGAYLGKKLLQGIFRNQLSPELVDAFQEEFNTSSHQAIQRIYNQPKPNHYLASFAPFVMKHRNHPDVYQLIIQTFNDFFDAFYFNDAHTDEPFHFSGSIAFHFSDFLRQVGSERGYLVKNIVQSPVSGLVLYHQQYD